MENNSTSAVAESWRTKLRPNARLTIVIFMMHNIWKLLHVSSPNRTVEQIKWVVKFEEISYTAARDLLDYWHRILQKLSVIKRTRDTGAHHALQQNGRDPVVEIHEGVTRWKQAEYRKKIIDKILNTSMLHYPISTPKEFLKAVENSTEFEEQVCTAATSEADYVHKIALGLLRMEVNAENSGRATSLELDYVSSSSSWRPVGQDGNIAASLQNFLNQLIQ